MLKVFNKTARQRIYTLADGSTLRVKGFSDSAPIEDNNMGNFIKSDIENGKLEVVKVSATLKENDTTKNDKGGKK